MVDLGSFQFGATLCVCGHPFVFACQASGLRIASGSRILDPPDMRGADGYRVTIVRHPFLWLRSCYENVRGSHTKVPGIDLFSDLYWKSKTFEEFVNAYLAESPGAVGRMFDAYDAHSMLKYEDMPRAGVQFLESIGEKHTKEAARFLDARGGNWAFDSNRELRAAVVRAERDFCDRAEYF